MNLKVKLNKLLGRLRGYLPERVPTSAPEFDSLCSSIINLYNPPMNDRSVQFTVAALLMRLSPTEWHKSKYFFYSSLMRGASAQVGAYMMEEIKTQQKAEFEAATKAAQLAEASDASVKPVQN